MADQASQSSASPSTPSSDQISMREAAFLAASRRLAAQPHTIPRIVGRTWRNPLSIQPPQFKRGHNIKSTPVPTPAISTESEKKRHDDKEVFGNILSHLEQRGGLPEAGVINQPLSTEEVTVVVNEEVVVLDAVMNEEEAGKGTLALETPEVTANAETYDGPSRVMVVVEVAMDEVTMETQPKVVEEKKKKKKSKGRKAGEAESYHHRKEKKNKEKKDDDEDEEAKKERKRKEKEERRERQHEKKCLRKE
ncbi:nucleoporin GLE1-like [Benincasa hispida]|uniref:nucleoporin GLE1-like n=1 Tax=Benincasa hispida TaxID=102211 RepID=UPI0018FFE379|nr:nucleoporin GLE1-like [Benincasa hispida]